MEEQKSLKVGDRIYEMYRDRINNVLTIQKVTKTQAISQGNRFKINYLDKDIDRVNRDSWSVVSYFIETPELIDKFRRQLIIAILQGTDYNKLSTETLMELNAIVSHEK